MENQRLSSVAAVIEKIGVARLKKITGKADANVSNWKAAGFFPSTTYVVITAELDTLNCEAPLRLWRGMIVPRKAA